MLHNRRQNMNSKAELNEYLEFLEKNKPISSRFYSALAFSSLLFLAIFIVYSFYTTSIEFEKLKNDNFILTEKISNSENLIISIDKKIADLNDLIVEKENQVEKLTAETKDKISTLQYSARGDLEDLSDLFKRVRSLEASMLELDKKTSQVDSETVLIEDIH
jgi:hypothetical protein